MKLLKPLPNYWLNSLALKTQKGFTLMGVLVGTVITAALTMTAASLIYQAKKSETGSNIQSEIDRVHFLNLQQLKSSAYIKANILQISTTTPRPVLSQCLGGSGVGCSGTNGQVDGINVNSGQTYSMSSTQNDPNCKSLVCAIVSSVVYTVNCSATACASVELKLTTTFNPAATNVNAKNYTFVPRVADTLVPGIVLGTAQPINYSCATGGKFITSLNYQQSTAVCAGIPTGRQITNCGTNTMMSSFAYLTPTCQNLISNTGSCIKAGTYYGFASLGDFTNQSICRATAIGPTAATAAGCTNGTNNPPSCNTCSTGYTFNGTGCVAQTCTPGSTSSGGCPSITNGSSTQTCNAGGTGYGSCTSTCAGGYTSSGTQPNITCTSSATGHWVQTSISGEDQDSNCYRNAPCSNLSAACDTSSPVIQCAQTPTATCVVRYYTCQ